MRDLPATIDFPKIVAKNIMIQMYWKNNINNNSSNNSNNNKKAKKYNNRNKNNNKIQNKKTNKTKLDIF